MDKLLGPVVSWQRHPQAATGSGPYRSSGLGEAYQAALAAPEEIHVKLDVNLDGC